MAGRRYGVLENSKMKTTKTIKKFSFGEDVLTVLMHHFPKDFSDVTNDFEKVELLYEQDLSFFSYAWDGKTNDHYIIRLTYKVDDFTTKQVDISLPVKEIKNVLSFAFNLPARFELTTEIKDRNLFLVFFLLKNPT